MVSVRPSDFDSGPRPLENTDKERNLISTMTLDEVQRTFLAPPADDPKLYLDASGVPCTWAECYERVSSPHLSLHAFCLASHDEKLRELVDVRRQAKEATRGNVPGLAWLRRRPKFYLNGFDLESVRTKIRFWTWDYKMSMAGFAKSVSFTSRAIVLSYGAMSMLNSGIDLGGWDDSLRDITSQWENFIETEVTEIRRNFNLGIM